MQILFIFSLLGPIKSNILIFIKQILITCANTIGLNYILAMYSFICEQSSEIY